MFTTLYAQPCPHFPIFFHMFSPLEKSIVRFGFYIHIISNVQAFSFHFLLIFGLSPFSPQCHMSQLPFFLVIYLYICLSVSISLSLSHSLCSPLPLSTFSSLHFQISILSDIILFPISSQNILHLFYNLHGRMTTHFLSAGMNFP